MLAAGGLGEDGDGCGRAGEAELVAGEGAQVVQQAVEAEVGAAVLVVLAGGFGLGGCRAPGGGDGVRLGGRFLVGVGRAVPRPGAGAR